MYGLEMSEQEARCRSRVIPLTTAGAFAFRTVV